MIQQEIRHAANRRRLAQPFLTLLQSSGRYGLIFFGGVLLRNHFFMPCRVQLNSVQTNPLHNQLAINVFPDAPTLVATYFTDICEYTRKN